MFKKILVPIDGSEGSLNALNAAKELGSKFGSELLVLNVTQPRESANKRAAFMAVPLVDGAIDEGDSELKKIGEQILANATEKLAGYPNNVEFKLEIGHPAERILAVAKEDGVDGIVIGSRGLSGIAEFFLGSVSSKVAQHAVVPVLIVK